MAIKGNVGTGAIAALLESTDAEVYLNMRDGNSDATFGAMLLTRGNDLTFTSGDAVKENVTIKGATGNVGIGTTSPASELTVEGDIEIISSPALVVSTQTKFK